MRLRPHSAFFAFIAAIGFFGVSAGANPKLSDWGVPTADKKVLRARTKNYINEKIYSGIKTEEEWTTHFKAAVEKGDASALNYLFLHAIKNKIETSADEPLDDQKNTALHLLAKSKHAAALKVLVKFGADVNQKNARGDTPLHAAVLGRYDATAKVLIKHPGVEFNAMNADGDIALIQAVRTKNEPIALLLASKLPKDFIDTLKVGEKSLKEFAFQTDNAVAFLVSSQGRGLSLKDIREAAKNNASQVMKAILADRREKYNDAHEPITAEDLNEVGGMTIEMGQFEAAIELGRKYPKFFEWKNKHGETIAHFAARNGQTAVLDELARFGVSLGLRSELGESPLDVAKKAKRLGAAKSAQWDEVYETTIVRLSKKGLTKPDLLERLGAFNNLNLVWGVYELIQKGEGKKLMKHYGVNWLSRLKDEQTGLSVLHLAVIKSDIAMVDKLLDLGFKLDIVDSAGHTALSLAMNSPNEDVKKAFLERGFVRGAPLGFGLPMYANEDVALLLVENGWYTPDQKNGETLLKVGAQMNWPRVIEMAYARGESPLMTVGESDTPLLGFCAPQMPKAFAAFIKHPDFSDLSRLQKLKNKHGTSPIEFLLKHAACRSLPMAIWLAEKGLIPNTDEKKFDVLSTALYSGELELVSALLKAGINPNQSFLPNKFGHLYTHLKNPKIVQLLLDNGAIVDRATYGGILEWLFALEDAALFEEDNVYARDSLRDILPTFDNLVRADVLQVESSFNVFGRSIAGPIKNIDANVKVRNDYLRRIGKIRRETRQARGCAEAKTATQAEFLAASAKAQGVFEMLWPMAVLAWEDLSKNKPTKIRRLLSTLDPRNLQLQYFRESSYDKATSNVNVELDSYKGRYAHQIYHRPCSFKADQKHVMYIPGHDALEPLRWICLRALENEGFEKYRFRIGFGAFNKSGSPKVLSAAEVGHLLKTAPDQLDVGLQVAIGGDENLPVARVKVSVWPPDTRLQKEDRKLEFLKELGFDRVENYFAKHYPQCADRSSKRSPQSSATDTKRDPSLRGRQAR